MANKFADVKVGDRVWANSGVKWLHGKDALKAVVKTTPAFIYLEGGAEFNTFKRDGEAYGKWMVGRISRVATPQECAAWDGERAQEAGEQQAREELKRRRQAQCAELRELFSPDSETNTVYVLDAEWAEHRRAGQFDVKFHGLTETQVRELATMLRPSPSQSKG